MRRGVACALVCVAALTGGCEGLGSADEAQARRVALQYKTGYPAYEGQALVQMSCGAGAPGGFCHSPSATAGARIGVPAGLDFDLAPCRPPGEDCSVDEAFRLAQNQDRMNAHAGRAHELIEAARMPPGDKGAAVAQAGRTRLDYRNAAGDPLPPVGSAAGTEIVRNWLAAGAPVVEASVPQGDDCGSDTVTLSGVGACAVQGEAHCAITPTWSSIYDCIMQTSCVPCHGPGGLDQRGFNHLDLSLPSNEVYQSLIGAPAAGVSCVGTGDVLVVPGAPDDSLLVRKLEAAPAGDPGLCGDPMPASGQALAPEQIQAVRQWVQDGATFD